MAAARDRIVATVDAYVAGVGARDADAIMALYADDPTIEDPVGTPPKVGRDAIRAFYEQLAGVNLSTRRLGPVTVVGDHAAFMFVITVDLGDSTLEMVTTDVMTFDDDARIETMVAYADGEAKPDGS